MVGGTSSYFAASHRRSLNSHSLGSLLCTPSSALGSASEVVFTPGQHRHLGHYGPSHHRSKTERGEFAGGHSPGRTPSLSRPCSMYPDHQGGWSHEPLGVRGDSAASLGDPEMMTVLFDRTGQLNTADLSLTTTPRGVKPSITFHALGLGEDPNTSAHPTPTAATTDIHSLRLGHRIEVEMAAPLPPLMDEVGGGGRGLRHFLQVKNK